MKTMNGFEAAVEINGSVYTARVSRNTDNDKVTIFKNGLWATEGRWAGSHIVDASGDLGEDVYDALDEALEQAECDASE